MSSQCKCGLARRVCPQLLGQLDTTDIRPNTIPERRRSLTSFRGEEPDLAAAAAIFASTTYWSIKVNRRRIRQEQADRQSTAARGGVKREDRVADVERPCGASLHVGRISPSGRISPPAPASMTGAHTSRIYRPVDGSTRT